MTQRDCEHGQLARACLVCELQAEVARLNAQLDDMYGTDPCPKCGYGVDSCYGCKLVERDSEIAALKAKLAAVCEAGKAVLNEYDQDCPHCCDYKTPPHADQCEIGQLGHALAAEALIPASKWEVKG